MRVCVSGNDYTFVELQVLQKNCFCRFRCFNCFCKPVRLFPLQSQSLIHLLHRHLHNSTRSLQVSESSLDSPDQVINGRFPTRREGKSARTGIQVKIQPEPMAASFASWRNISKLKDFDLSLLQRICLFGVSLFWYASY